MRTYNSCTVWDCLAFEDRKSEADSGKFVPIGRDAKEELVTNGGKTS